MDSSNNSSSSSSHSALAVVEEPEYLACYLVIKHSWRGRYKQILCFSNVAITTLDPATLSVTDFDSAAPIINRDENSNEFNLSVRTDGRGKFKGIKFSSRYRASILTELHKIRGNRLGAVAEFPVLHLRRRNVEWVPLEIQSLCKNSSWSPSILRYLQGNVGPANLEEEVAKG